MAVSRVFELFPMLPAEIRHLIWKAALPFDRVVKFEYSDDEFDEWDVVLDFGRRDVEYLEDHHGTALVELLRECPECLWLNDIPTMGKLELRRLMDRLGCDMYQEDTRSLAEKDLRLHCHKYARESNGQLKRQMQLKDYRFTSSRAAPTLAHVLEYNTTYYQGPDAKLPKYLSPQRTFYPIVCKDQDDRTNRPLERYGFTTSRPTPEYKYRAPLTFGSDGETTKCTDNVFPTILHVCGESRAVAIREGYALAFGSLQFPAKMWFNPYDNFIDLRMDSPTNPEAMETDCKSLKCARKIIIDLSFFDVSGALLLEARPVFKYAEEVVIIFEHYDVRMSDLSSREEYIKDFRIVDATEAEILATYIRRPDILQDPYFVDPDYYTEELCAKIIQHKKYHPYGPTFFESRAREIEQQLTIYRLQSPCLDDQTLKPPLVRFAFFTSAFGEENLRRIRQQYWMEREMLPPPDVEAEIYAEELDRIRLESLHPLSDSEWWM